MASKEAVVHQNYKDYIVKAKDIDTRVTGRSTGHPVRVLRNAVTKEYLELEKKGASFEELESLTVGGLRRAVQEGRHQDRKSYVRADRRHDPGHPHLPGDYRPSGNGN